MQSVRRHDAVRKFPLLPDLPPSTNPSADSERKSFLLCTLHVVFIHALEVRGAASMSNMPDLRPQVESLTARRSRRRADRRILPSLTASVPFGREEGCPVFVLYPSEKLRRPCRSMPFSSGAAKRRPQRVMAGIRSSASSCSAGICVGAITTVSPTEHGAFVRLDLPLPVRPVTGL